MNMSGVSASGSASRSAGGMAGMSGCSGSQHSQMAAGKSTAAEKNTASTAKPLSVDPKLGKAVDISV